MKEENKCGTKFILPFSFNCLMGSCNTRTNRVQNSHRRRHCLSGFNNLKVDRMSQNSLRLVEDKSVDKSKALEAALSQIERSFGKGSIMKLGSNENVVEIETVSTGSLGLDIALGIGGLPKGRIIEIYGPESSGKTTLALQTIAGSAEEGRHLRLRRRRTCARSGLCPQARRRPAEPSDLAAGHRRAGA